MSCSDPVPPPAQGGVTHRFSVPTPRPPDTNCPAQSYAMAIGGPKAPPANGPGNDVVIDEENGATVSCTVRKSGGGFAVSGSLQQLDKFFSISGTFADTGDGAVSVGGDVFAYVNAPQTECKVTVHKAQSGAIWADYNCPVTDPKSPESYCVASGTFVFENCSE